MNNSKIKDLIDKVNEQLLENWNKPVIKDGNHYDTVNGRKVISPSDAQDIIDAVFGVYFGLESYEVGVYNSETKLHLKFKKKKSGIKGGWGKTDKMTVVHVGINTDVHNDNVALNKILNSTMGELVAEQQKIKEEAALKYQEAKDAKKLEFINYLDGQGCTFQKFMEMKKKYDNLSYEVRNEINKLYVPQ
jgi:hypothetical protein